MGTAVLRIRELEEKPCDGGVGVTLFRDSLGLILHLLFEPLKLLGASIGMLYRTAVGECGGLYVPVTLIRRETHLLCLHDKKICAIRHGALSDDLSWLCSLAAVKSCQS